MSDNNLSKLMIIEKKSLTFYDVDFLNGDFLFCFEPMPRLHNWNWFFVVIQFSDSRVFHSERFYNFWEELNYCVW